MCLPGNGFHWASPASNPISWKDLALSYCAWGGSQLMKALKHQWPGRTGSRSTLEAASILLIQAEVQWTQPWILVCDLTIFQYTKYTPACWSQAPTQSQKVMGLGMIPESEWVLIFGLVLACCWCERFCLFLSLFFLPLCPGAWSRLSLCLAVY
jgi:hypothetical protein